VTSDKFACTHQLVASMCNSWTKLAAIKHLLS
jgi:hypothetical protein